MFWFCWMCFLFDCFSSIFRVTWSAGVTLSLPGGGEGSQRGNGTVWTETTSAVVRGKPSCGLWFLVSQTPITHFSSLVKIDSHVHTKCSSMFVLWRNSWIMWFEKECNPSMVKRLKFFFLEMNEVTELSLYHNVKGCIVGVYGTKLQHSIHTLVSFLEASNLVDREFTKKCYFSPCI